MNDQRTEWGDKRLDELARRVEQSATKEDVNYLRREIADARKAAVDEVQIVGRKVEELVGSPISERRARNRAFGVAIMGAAAGGFATFLIYVISEGLK